MSSSTARKTSGSALRLLTQAAPGLNSRPLLAVSVSRLVCLYLLRTASRRFRYPAVAPVISIHGCSSGGTAWLVSWPPTTLPASVNTTRRPSSLAASAAATPPTPPPTTSTSQDSSVGLTERAVRAGLLTTHCAARRRDIPRRAPPR